MPDAPPAASPDPAPPGPPAPSAPRRKRRFAALALLTGLLLVAGTAAFQWWPRGDAMDGLLQVNGRIEGDHVTVAPKQAGRITALLAREGDRVRAGQVVLRLDDRAVRARLDRALAARDTLQAQVAAQTAALALLKREVSVAVRAAQTQVSGAQAELRRAQGSVDQSRREVERARSLAGQGFVGPQALERAELALTQSQDQRDTAKAALAHAHEGLRDAELAPARVQAREAELAATRAQLKEAVAAIAEAQSALDDLVLTAPVAGTVTSRYVNEGEVVNAGTPALELVDLSSVYLKGYIPEPAVGRIRRGMPARIHVDAYPDQPFPAQVRYIAARAEFTPKEVQTVDERVKLVYEVRLYADADPQGRLNPGQPADGVIRWKENAAWAPPRH